jgi:hypothetical protein
VPIRCWHGPGLFLAYRAVLAADRVTVLPPHRPCALRAASTMCARANSWATVAAVSGKRFGSTMVGAAGQTMRTTGGWLSGWISSMVSVSAPLMGPWARVVDDWDAVPPGASRPRSPVLPTPPGPLMWMWSNWPDNQAHNAHAIPAHYALSHNNIH